MKITFSTQSLPKRGAVAVMVAEGRKLLASGTQLDQAAGGALTRAMNASRFKGQKKELLDVLAPPGLSNSRVLLAGIGDPEALELRDLQL